MRALLFIAGLSVALVACGGSDGLAKLESQASADFNCPPEEVTAAETAMSTGEASGCGHSVMYKWNSAEQKWFSVLDRATFDLDCPKHELSVMELGGKHQVGVSGCGQKATYVYSSAGWIQNTDSERTDD